MQVELVQVTRGRERVVGVRALAGGRVLFACSGTGERGGALALVEAVAFSARSGHTIEQPEARAFRRLELSDGSVYVLEADWLRGRSSAEIAARLRAVREVLRAAPVAGTRGPGPAAPTPTLGGALAG
jgi:hypothetical protein